MKKVSILIIAAGFYTVAIAQTKPKASSKISTPVKKSTAAPIHSSDAALKTMTDSASYAIGISIAQSINKDFKDLNKAVFLNAVKTVMDGKTSKLNEEQSRTILEQFTRQAEEINAHPNIKEGEAFLQKNKTQPNIKTTASGLQYEVVKEGTGIPPTPTDVVVCHYKGTLIDGTEFDNSYERGKPLTIALNGGIIRGWIEGLQLMAPGAHYRFYIPQQLGYGLRSVGNIPPGSVLIFDIELQEIQK